MTSSFSFSAFCVQLCCFLSQRYTINILELSRSIRMICFVSPHKLYHWLDLWWRQNTYVWCNDRKQWRLQQICQILIHFIVIQKDHSILKNLWRPWHALEPITKDKGSLLIAIVCRRRFRKFGGLYNAQMFKLYMTAMTLKTGLMVFGLH